MVLLEAHAQDLWLILKPRADTAHMHEIPVVSISPTVFHVVNNEFQVRRDPRRLDGAQVNPQHFRTGVLVRHY